jgi:tetratricopeptide (TPR) repeat protein
MSPKTAVFVALTGVVLSGSALLAIRPKTEQTTSAPRTSAEAAATDAMNNGLKRLAKAEAIETRNPHQARREYEAALKQFETAARLAPGNYRAHNNVGYSNRKLGHYERALESYDRALKLAPAFAEAIEYRAEACLALNRLDEVRQAYMHLFVNDRATSQVLMKAMKSWVVRRRTEPAGLDAETLSAFEAWVRERDTLAASVLNLGHDSPDWK